MADDLQPWAITQARKHGIPVKLFLALGGQESGGKQSAVSPKGALGWGQLMPGTAKGLGVDPKDPYQNIEGAARYLKEQYDHFGSWRLALAAYNAGPNAVAEYGGVPPFHETTQYVHNILTRAGGFDGPGTQAGAESYSTGKRTPSASPATGSREAALTGLADLAQGRYSPTKALQELLSSQDSAPVALQAGQSGAGISVDTTTAPQTKNIDVSKYVKLSPTADRKGVPTHQDVLDFVGRVGQRVGEQLIIGTGSNHSEHTVNGSVSDHWRGMGADVPASGDKLHQLGYWALIEAGMSERDAALAAKKGGLFNVGRYQIIFATDAPGVGNHFDHLHVGIRG